MTYKLAQDLKQNGFPQLLDGEGFFVNRFQEVYGDEILIDPTVVYVPALDELIGACGQRFRKLELKPDTYSELTGPWMAWYWVEPTPLSSNSHYVYGFTPKEAVARAWLSINRKDNNIKHDA